MDGHMVALITFEGNSLESFQSCNDDAWYKFWLAWTAGGCWSQWCQNNQCCHLLTNRVCPERGKLWHFFNRHENKKAPLTTSKLESSQFWIYLHPFRHHFADLGKRLGRNIKRFVQSAKDTVLRGIHKVFTWFAPIFAMALDALLIAVPMAPS